MQRFLTASEAVVSAFRMLLITVLHCAFTAHREYAMFFRSWSVPFTVRVE